MKIKPSLWSLKWMGTPVLHPEAQLRNQRMKARKEGKCENCLPTEAHYEQYGGQVPKELRWWENTPILMDKGVTKVWTGTAEKLLGKYYVKKNLNDNSLSFGDLLILMEEHKKLGDFFLEGINQYQGVGSFDRFHDIYFQLSDVLKDK